MNRLAAGVIPLVWLSCLAVYAKPPQSLDFIAQAGSKPASVPPETAQDNSRATLEMRGDILMAKKMYPEAIHVYESILATSPNDAALLNKIGVANQQNANSTAAARYYKRAMKSDKTYASAVNNLGTIEYERRHFGRAIRLYKQAMALHPKAEGATLYSNLGYAYFAAKQFPEAMDCFEKALRLDPDVFGHHGGFGSTVQQRTSTDPGLFNFLVAKTYAKQGDAEHCAHYLKMARDDGYKKMADVKIDPDFARVIKDPRVQDVLQTTPSYAAGETPDTQKPQPQPPQQQQ